MKFLLLCVALLTQCVCIADDVWPFAIVRQYGTAANNVAFMQAMLRAQDRHPGLVDETWLGGNLDAFDGTNILKLCVKPSIEWREKCKSRGIAFSYQALTLNHTEMGPMEGFTDEAWAVDNKGVKLYGIFCANSQEAKRACKYATEEVLRELKPDAFWPDDDLRLIKGDSAWKGTGGVCFCDRCIDIFNKETNSKWTRKSLSDVLFSDDSGVLGYDAAKVRDEWSCFNSRTLARYASIYREVVDRVRPECRLGLQLTSASSLYHGDDYSEILKALAGNDKRGIGCRPGGGWYNERSRYALISKGYQILRETTRMRNLPFGSQFCYEAENWPHVSSAKTPGAMMLECSYMLALGCNSLALYWGADMNREPDEDYDFFFDTFAKWKGFMQAIVRTSENTLPIGLSDYNGVRDRGGKNWMMKTQGEFQIYSENSIPVTAPGGKCQAFVISASQAEKLVEEDLRKLFKCAILMEGPAWEILAKKFPNEKIFTKLKFTTLPQLGLATSMLRALELFEGDKKAGDLEYVITPLDKDVVALSEITTFPGACGTCIVPTGEGGNIILMQRFRGSSAGFWTNYRRNAILDALDKCVDGGMGVRLHTGCFALPIVARANALGQVKCAYITNFNYGHTRELEFSVRNAFPGEWEVISPFGAVEFKAKYNKDGSIDFKLPAMNPASCIFLKPKNIN